MAIGKTTNKGLSKIEEQLKRLKEQEQVLKAQLKAEKEASILAVGEFVRANLDKLPEDLRDQVAFTAVSEQVAELQEKIIKLTTKQRALSDGANKKAGEVILQDDVLTQLPEKLRKKVEDLAGIDGEPEVVEEQLELREQVLEQVEPEHQDGYQQAGEVQ